MQSNIESLLSKEMDRKEFIKVVAAGLVSVVGLGAIGGLIAPSKSKGSTNGYGSSAYGGFKNNK
jgi:hypothetical protein